MRQTAAIPQPAAAPADSPVRHHEFRGAKSCAGWLRYERWQFEVLRKICSGFAQYSLVEYVCFETLGKDRDKGPGREWVKNLSYRQIAKVCDVSDTAARLIVSDAVRRRMLDVRKSEKPTCIDLKPLVDNWEYVLGWGAWRKAQDKLVKYVQENGRPWTAPLTYAAIAELLADPKKPEVRLPESDVALIVTDACERGILELKMAGRGQFNLQYLKKSEGDAADQESEEEEKNSPTPVGKIVVTRDPVIMLPGARSTLPLSVAKGPKLDFEYENHTAGEISVQAVHVEDSRVRFAIRNGAKCGEGTAKTFPGTVGKRPALSIDSKRPPGETSAAELQSLLGGLGLHVEESFAARLVPSIPAGCPKQFIHDQLTDRITRAQNSRKPFTTALLPVFFAETIPQKWASARKQYEPAVHKSPAPSSQEDVVEDLANAIYMLAEMPKSANAAEFRAKISRARHETPNLYAEAMRRAESRRV